MKREIIRQIEWPGFGKALWLAAKALFASVTIGAVLFFYGIGIDRCLAMILRIAG